MENGAEVAGPMKKHAVRIAVAQGQCAIWIMGLCGSCVEAAVVILHPH